MLLYSLIQNKLGAGKSIFTCSSVAALSDYIIDSGCRLFARASLLYVRFWFPPHLVLVPGYWFVLLCYILGSGSRFVLLDRISHLVVKFLVMKPN